MYMFSTLEIKSFLAPPRLCECACVCVRVQNRRVTSSHRLSLNRKGKTFECKMEIWVMLLFVFWVFCRKIPVQKIKKWDYNKCIRIWMMNNFIQCNEGARAAVRTHWCAHFHQQFSILLKRMQMKKWKEYERVDWLSSNCISDFWFLNRTLPFYFFTHFLVFVLMFWYDDDDDDDPPTIEIYYIIINI